jgi:polyhydroxyalkanoate synthesis repressor PhaR
MTTLIKRYSNRKLYNTETSRYITLKGIAELIEHGEEVRVIDNETGEDITSIALSQILVDSERSQRAVPGSVLSDLIQKGGDALYGALKRGVEDASDGIGDLQRNVRRAIKTREEEAQRIREAWGETRAEWRSEWDGMIEGAVERVFKALDLPRRSDIEVLNRNLVRVAEALEGLGRTATGPTARSERAREKEASAPAPEVGDN